MAETIAGWRDDDRFRQSFTTMLAECPYEAFFFETPSITDGSLDETFECVLVDSPVLARIRADAGAFEARFRATRDDTATFANLGGDALLIAPCPRGDAAACRHLGSFSREAGAARNSALWRSVARAVDARLSRERLWISTSGLGVHWLHLRLDSRPKYYTHAPYRDPGRPAEDGP